MDAPSKDFLKTIFIVLFTIVSFCFLFPNSTIPINEAVRLKYCFSQLETKVPSWSNALADAIQIPLGLRWYDVTIKNVSRLKEGFVFDRDANFDVPSNGAATIDIPVSGGRYSKVSIPIPSGLSDSSHAFGKIPIGDTASFTYFVPNEADSNSDANCITALFHTVQIFSTRWINPGSEPPEALEMDFKVLARPNPIARYTKLLILFIFFVFFVPPLLDYVLLPLWHLLRWLQRKFKYPHRLFSRILKPIRSINFMLNKPMAKKWVADCSKFPSESHCDLKISGSDKDVVAEVAYQHAIGFHKHVSNEVGLRDGIKKMLVQE